MSRDNPWAKHRQKVYLEMAQDERLPLWQRVAFVAMGLHKANRHAPLLRQRNELAAMLGKPSKRIVEAISEAKKRGWLAGESTTKCLVVPAHWIEGGLGGEYDACPVHPRPRRPTTVPKAPEFPEPAPNYPEPIRL